MENDNAQSRKAHIEISRQRGRDAGRPPLDKLTVVIKALPDREFVGAMRTLNRRVADALAQAECSAVMAGAASGAFSTSESKVGGAFEGAMVGILVGALRAPAGNPARLDDLGLNVPENPRELGLNVSENPKPSAGPEVQALARGASEGHAQDA